MAAANPAIGLSVDASHVILNPGEATNITLTIHNNGSSIETYSINVSGFDSHWEVVPSESNVSGVIPTFSEDTIIAVRLSTNATPIHSTSLSIDVSESDSNITTSIIVLLSVNPRYLPAIDGSSAGDNGLVVMTPGDTTNVSVVVRNDANVEDTLLLSIDQSPDLASFWSNWTSGQNSNQTGNNTGGNNTGGNNTGGNNTGGNNTGGNNTGGNNTGGNNTGGNNSGGNNTGGNNTGGNNTGGNNTGGNNTGGNNSGGNNTGGNNTGGNNTGGNTSNMISMISSPQGWDVRFIDDVMDNMSVGEVRNSILHLSVPTNEAPGYYGFDLYAASALGNFSVHTTIVVEITAVHNLSLSHSLGEALLPGDNTTSTIEITSLSSAQGNWTWSSTLDSGPCDLMLPILKNSISVDEVTSLEVIITASSNSHVGDECAFTVLGVLDSDTSITESISTMVIVGEIWALSMVIPSAIKLDVGIPESFTVAISNDGTENDTLQLIGIDQPGVTFSNPSPVELERDASQYVSLSVTIDEGISGNVTLHFSLSSINSGNDSVLAQGIFEVKPYASFEIDGPSEGRVSIAPGENSTLTLAVSNTGTRNLTIDQSISGLPSGISISGLDDFSVNANETIFDNISFTAGTSVQPQTTSITVTMDSGWNSQSITLDLQITDRKGLSIGSTASHIVASPITDSNLTVMLTNLGSNTDTFLLSLDTSATSNWFSVTADSLSSSIGPGNSDSITLSIRETTSGAPVSGVDLLITVTSTSDSTIYENLTISIIPQVASGTITVLTDSDQAEPGQNIYGNVVITNSGTAIDSMMITTLELDCNLDEIITLDPGVSSQPIAWSCTIPEGTSAGFEVLTFRLTSSSRTNMIVENSEGYTVKPLWADGDIIDFQYNQNNLKFERNNDQHTIQLRICNKANTLVTGNLELIGTNQPLMDGQFFRSGEIGINNTFEMGSLGCQDFNLILTPLNLEGFNAQLTIVAVTQVNGQTVIDSSSELSVTVSGPHVPPSGINLGILELDNQNSITILAVGWVMSLLLLAYIRLRKPIEVIDEVEEEEPLGPNEVRIDEYNKVTCISCEARLGVPENSEPPFRFTCPKCSEKIRVVP
jgi:uncharacterized membrane protein